MRLIVKCVVKSTMKIYKVEGENEPNNGETCESKRKIEIP